MSQIDDWVTATYERTKGCFMALVFGVIYIALWAITIGVLYEGINGIRVKRMLERDGVVANGRVIDKYIRPDATDDLYWVVYEWFVGDQRYERKVDEKDLFNASELGDSLPIRYLPSDPSMSRLEDYEFGASQYFWDVFAIAAGLLFGAVGLLIGGVGISSAVQRLRAFLGYAQPAPVDDVSP